MKLSNIAAALLFILASTKGANAILAPDDPNLESAAISEERVLDLWGIKQTSEVSGEDIEFWTAWGFETIEKQTQEIINRELTLAFYPDQTSSRVWRMGFVNLKLSSGTDEVRRVCFLEEEQECRKTAGVRTYVAPREGQIDKLEEFNPSDFTIETDIEEFRLVWLVDFFTSLKEKSQGETLNIDGIIFENWPREGETFTGYKEWRDKDYTMVYAKGGHLLGKPWGYEVWFCIFDKDRKKCQPSSNWPVAFVYFPSPNEVRVEFFLAMS